MKLYLGLDTSNYTTSAAVYDFESNTVRQSKLLLPVKEGEAGLRQSDAVFHHVRQLPHVVAGLEIKSGEKFSAIGVSAKPRNIEGSYMPCFLAGVAAASSAASVAGIQMFETSHQVGHILAALYSCGKLGLARPGGSFLAFHISGGTTDCLLVKGSSKDILCAERISTSLDIHAGQLVDRVGLMLGLRFPCGVELEKLAMQSYADFRFKPKLKEGSCCLSGIENKCMDMLRSGEKPCDIAMYALKYIEAVIRSMTEYALVKLGDMPVIYAGGVMSNMIIRKRISESYEAYFAEPCYSCDNAAGIAIYAAMKDGCLL